MEAIDRIERKMGDMSMNAMNEINEIGPNFEHLNGRINAIEEKLDKVYNDKEKSFKNKVKTPLLAKTKHGHSHSPQTTSCLVYNLHPAASKVGKIRIQFCDRLKKKISSENKQLQDDLNGPSVVFAINSSRIQSDLQRDLKSGNIMRLFLACIFFPVKTAGPTLLIIIKPMREPEKTSPRLMSDNLGGFPIESSHYLFVDSNATELHDCDVNSNTVNAVARFIAENQ